MSDRSSENKEAPQPGERAGNEGMHKVDEQKQEEAAKERSEDRGYE